jgi:Spy/CpxP family protein refolding chaperone
MSRLSLTAIGISLAALIGAAPAQAKSPVPHFNDMLGAGNDGESRADASRLQLQQLWTVRTACPQEAASAYDPDRRSQTCFTTMVADASTVDDLPRPTDK